jgi:hypothetical protein
MRGRRLALLIVLTLGAACRSAKTEPEAGAVLVHVKCAPGAPTPDELRAWVYDEGGVLWDGVRIPADGALAPASAQDLGTVLIQPGQIRGQLRVHMRGYAAGARISDGTLAIASPGTGGRVYDLVLDAALPPDADGDDVPDAIDDCPAAANPAQGGCATATAPEASPDASNPDGEVDGGNEALEVSADSPDDTGADVAESDDIGAEDADARLATPDGPAPGLEALGGPDLAEAGLPDAALDAPGDQASESPRDLGADLAVDVARDSSGGFDLPGDEGEPDGLAGPACLDGGSCNLTQGDLCNANAECASGFCADGVCCTNACQGPCRSCNQPNATGTCQGYPAGLDPEGECGGGATCNGVGACGTAPPSNLPNGQLCALASQCKSGICKDGVCCDAACDGPCLACGTGTCVVVRKSDDVPECTGTMTCNPRGACVAR